MTGSIPRAGVAIGPLAIALLLPPGPLAAAEPQPLSAGDARIVDFAFATRLGSGIYDVAGRTVQIYRIPIAWTVRDEDEHRVGIRLTFPVTFGFLDFKTSDLIEGDLPDDLSTLSLVPGVEVRVPVRPGWLLKPFVEGGRVFERSGKADAWIVTTGLGSFNAFVSGGFRVGFGNELVLCRTAPTGDLPNDGFASFETAAEARHNVGWAPRGHEVDLGPYLAIDVFYQGPSIPIRSYHRDFAYSTEIGITGGTEIPAKLWKIEIPRFGLGYRFGDGGSAYRIVFGIPVPALRR